jgi:hypothetical protein
MSVSGGSSARRIARCRVSEPSRRRGSPIALRMASARAGLRPLSATRSGRIREKRGWVSQFASASSSANTSPRSEPVSGVAARSRLNVASTANTMSCLEVQRRYRALLPTPARFATASIDSRP